MRGGALCSWCAASVYITSKEEKMTPARWPAVLFFAMLSLAPQAAMAVCGDSNREASETCDDGNVVSGDGCSSTCQVEGSFVCESGDFTLQARESISGGTQPGWTLSADRRRL